MQIHVDRAAFVEAATKAASFADDPMPVVRIDAADRLTFSATNNERFCRLTIDANIGKRGAIVVDAHRIASIAKGLTGPVVEITSTDARLTVKCGATYTIPLVGLIDIMAPAFPDEAADVNGAALARAMTATSYAIGGGATKSGVPGVWMEQRPDEILVTSTDGHRLAHSAFATKGRISIPLRTVLTAEACKGLAGLGGVVSLGFTIGWVHARIGSDVYAWRCIETDAPEWRVVMPGNHDVIKVATFKTADLLGAMRRANNVVSKAARPTKFTVSPTDCNIHTPGETEHSEPIPCETGASFIEGVRPAYVVDAIVALGNVDRVRVEVRGTLLPIIIRPEDESESFAIVMPMRIDG
jgi:DNA polymerase-3 subunit beta